MDELKALDPVALAVLADRLERMLKDHAEVKAAIQSIHTSMGQVAVIQRDIVALDGKINSFVKALDAVESVQNAHAQTLSNHATIWKIATAICLSCLGLVGWAYSKVEGLQDRANSNAQRIGLLEYQLNGASPKVAEQLLRESEAQGKAR